MWVISPTQRHLTHPVGPNPHCIQARDTHIRRYRKTASTHRTALSHARHTICINEGVVGPNGPITDYFFRRVLMTWTKPEAEVVAVTMEVTAYVATL